MITCMVLLQQKNPLVIRSSKAISIFEDILDVIDKFNHIAPGMNREDREDLSWPGVWSRSSLFIMCQENWGLIHCSRSFHMNIDKFNYKSIIKMTEYNVVKILNSDKLFIIVNFYLCPFRHLCFCRVFLCQQLYNTICFQFHMHISDDEVTLSICNIWVLFTFEVAAVRGDAPSRIEGIF